MRSAAPGSNFDVVVIGGGFNGLVCGTMLAQTKRRVLLLEARERVGGLCHSSEITPGARVSTIAHLVGPLDPEVVKALKLAKLGLQFSAKQIGAVALAPDGRHIALGDDLRHTAQSLGAHSASDAKAWANFETRIRKTAQHIAPWMHQSPGIAGETTGRSGFFGAKSAGRSIAPLESEFASRLDGSLSLLLEEAFETPLLKGAIAFDALLGNSLAPSMNGTALLLVMKRALDWQNAGGLGHPQGGAGGLIQAVIKAAEASGLKMKTGARAKQFLFENGRVAGVELANGETIYAPCVVSSLGPKQTYLRMGAERDLPLGFKRQLHGFRNEGSVAKVNLALNGAPSFKGLDKRHLKDRLLICSSLDELEQSYAAFEQGRFSPEIGMEITIPSMHDASLCRPGQHVMSINVAHVPRRLSSGSWDSAKEGLMTLVGAKLRQYAPELPDQVVAADIFSPQDISEMSGDEGGHWHGGDLSVDQLGVFRPSFAAQDRSSPVPGLFLCGAGTHPCGGLTGINGRLAYEAVVAHLTESA